MRKQSMVRAKWKSCSRSSTMNGRKADIASSEQVCLTDETEAFLDKTGGPGVTTGRAFGLDDDH
jgi:hypothetical protein